MKYKKSMIIIMLAVFLISIAAASASDVNEAAIASGDDGQIELSAGGEIAGDKLQTGEENPTLAVGNNDETVSAQTNSEILTDGQYNYTYLREQIETGGNKSLTKGTYTYNDDGDTIEITTSGVINGNGAVIDMAGSDIRAFKVTASGVIIKNLTIKNVNFDGNGGTIYFSSSGTVENCNFTDNKATGDYGRGGAVYFNHDGTVKNCNFVNNTASDEGGAIWIYSGTVTNCNFVDNKASYDSGALYFSSSGTVKNCNFVNNTAPDGGAIRMYSGTVKNCNFVNNTASDDSGAIKMYSGTVKNCNFVNNTASDDGGAIRFSDSGTVTNCNFTDNSARNGGAIRFNGEGTVTNCNFTNNTVTNGNGGAVYFNKNVEGNVTDCTFTNNSASKNGGAIYFDEYSKGRTINCNFTANQADYRGGAIYFSNSDTVENCNFTDNTAKYGGAIAFYGTGNVTNCNFVDNKATSYGGGAIYFSSSGTVENCNFTNNSALHGGSIRFSSTGNVTNCNFTNNTASRDGGAIDFGGTGTVTNCNFTNNSATQNGGAVYFNKNSEGNVTNCSFTNNSATQNGGAVYFDEDSKGRTINCNFTDNKVTGSNSWGGAVCFLDKGDVTNCNFTDNNATNGGAVFFESSGTVTNCSFTNNKVTGGYGGGAIDLECGGTVTNCNFTNNSANNGGAVRSGDINTLKNCNFINNKATVAGGAIVSTQKSNVIDCNFANNTANECGAAFIIMGSIENCNFTNNKATNVGSLLYMGGVIFISTGDITNCNFVNNTASHDDGGAVAIGSGSVENCNFTGNDASGNGGAVYFSKFGTVENCNFTNNIATNGGAVYFENTGNVTNCSFTGNNATWYGGAVYFYDNGEVTNCNFTDNTASIYGGAINMGSGNVTNCNFTGNNATTGSAIYFYTTSATKTVSNSCFLNNRANAETLEVTKNDNNVTITFTGNDNLLNAIYSRNDDEVTFTNVIYWSSNGIANTGSSPIKPSRSNREAGQNITVSVVVDDVIVLSEVYHTDENGTIVLDISAGENYYISARHDIDSYYTEAETINSTMKFNVNVTSQTTHNKTVNITAKSNIYNEVMPGKLLFIVPNTDPINATYAGNGTWWAVHIFDDGGDYNVNASYIGLDNVTINNATIRIVRDASVDVNNKTLDLLIDDTFTIVAVTTPEGLNVTFVPDDSGVYSIDENGKVTALRDGEGSILVKVEGNAGYAENSTIVNVTVSKIPTEITVLNDTLALEVSDEIAAGVTLTPGDAGNVTYSISNSSVVKVEGGKIIALAEGEATITVSFKGDNKYLSAENKTISVAVSKIPTNISIDPVSLDLFVGDETVIVATLTPGDAGNVTFTSSDNDIVLVEDDGNVIANGKGQAIITVSFAGNDKYAAAVNRTINVTVSLCNASVTVDNDTLDLKVGETYAINATKHPDTILLDINYTSSNSSVVSVDKNGIVTAVGEGTAVITVSVGDGEIYAENSTTINVFVNKKSTDISAEKVSTTYNVNKNLVVVLTDCDGNPLAGVNVTVELNTLKNYTTDEDGQIKVAVGKLTPDTYTATITFAGNEKYAQSNATAKVVVKKATPKLTAKAKTFKTTVKTKKFTITLKDNTGKPIAKAKVTLKVGGKTYYATTNSKGKATFKITKLSKKGKYNAVITYKANKYYKKVTKKVKITVKSVWKTVSKGSKDKNTVKKIQRALKANGYYLSYKGHYLMVDGIYKSCTERSVKEFQHDKGLKVTGKVDEKTAKKLGLI